MKTSFHILKFSSSAAQPLYQSLWNVSWRTVELTGRLLASCCQWELPSTWMGQLCTRQWQPSLSLRSMSMTWTLASWSLLGENKLIPLPRELFVLEWLYFTFLTSRLSYQQYNSNSSQHRGGWDTSSRSGYHGDCPDLCGVTTCWHLAHCGHRLGSVSHTKMILFCISGSYWGCWGDMLIVFFSFFLSDRFRTMINVLGDALAAGIMAHICKKDFEKAAASAAAVATAGAANNGGGRVRRMICICGGQSEHTHVRF